jgi:hypothetical protein
MQILLTEKQLNKIIEALEKNPEEVNDKFSLLSYLKTVKRLESECQQSQLDDIQF